MTPSPFTVFICHAGEDNQLAENICRYLRENGVDGRIDRWEFQIGDKLVARVFDEGISKCDFMVPVISRISKTKPWVREEIDFAFIQRCENKIKIFSVCVDGELPLDCLKSIIYYFD